MGKILEIVSSVKNGSSSAVEEVKKAIARAKENEEYHAFICLTEERALEQAAKIDQNIKDGKEVGSLAGVTYALKDNFLDFGVPTTAASKMLENFNAPIKSTAVEKLENQGAICIGRTNLDSFAHGGSTENSYFGPTLNSKDKKRVAGGSSGGSAVAVALGIVPFALGTDTGGSIRQPASYNGVIGFKPTYGTVSRYGVVAMASSTDTIGCFANDAEDTEIVMDVMSGLDKNDSTTLPDYFRIEEPESRKLKIGVIKDFLSDSIDPSVKKNAEDYINKLKESGHQIEYVDMPILKYALAIYYIVVPAEVSSNLARYDGVRYGYRGEGVSDIDELYGLSRDGGFMQENKRRILIGNYVLSSGFFDAYYLKAQKARTLLIEEFDKMFKKFDFMFCPVTPTPAFKLGENTSDPVKMYLEDAMTVPANLAGVPAISIPSGLTPEGLTTAVQLIGPKKSDAKILSLVKSMEEKK